MSRCPAIVFAVFFSLGILFSDKLSIHPSLFLSLAIISVLALLYFNRDLSYLARVGSSLFAGVLILSAGFLSGSAQHIDPPVAYSKKVSFDIRATNFSTESGEKLSFDSVLAKDEKDLGLRVYLSPVSINRNLRIHPGSLLKCSGQIEQITGARNPGQVDFSEIFRRKGIFYTLRNADCNNSAPSPRNVWSLGERFRGCVKRALNLAKLDSRTKGIALALSIGDRSSIDRETQNSFRRSGLSHLLAISGLHVGFVVLGIFHLIGGLLRRIDLPYRILLIARVIVVLMVLGFYVVITGFSDSVVRSGIMCAVFLMSLLQKRKFNALNSLGLSACIILIFRPFHLFQVGFQLSIAAVFGILLIHSKIQKIISDSGIKSMKGVLSSISVSGVAYLATAPILITHFGFAPITGVVATLLAAPFCFLSLVSTWVLVMFSEVDFLVPLIRNALGSFTLIFVEISDFMDVDIGSDEIRREKALWFACLISFLLASWRMASRSVYWKIVFFIPAFIFASSFFGKNSGETDVVFFDVGHGDAILIRTPSGNTALIDAGDKSKYRDVGSDILLPAFRKLGIQKINYVFISHRHRDHYGGLESLLGEIDIDKILSNDNGLFVSESWSRFIKDVDFLGIERLRLAEGDRLKIDEVSIQILNPPIGARLEGENNQSLQMHWKIGNLGFLFLGDSELEEEWALLENENLTKTDLVKVGHHGSKTSSSKELIEVLKHEWNDGKNEEKLHLGVYPLPEKETGINLSSSLNSSNLDRQDKRPKAIISASAKFRRPSRDVMARWKEAGFDLECTCEKGAIWFKIKDGKIDVYDWK